VSLITRLLSGFDLFDLCRFLLVFGLSLGVLQYIHTLTNFKSPRKESRKKLIAAGWGLFLIGIVIGIMSMLSTIPGEIKSIKGIGTDIVALGSSCVLHTYNLEKQKHSLVWAMRSLLLSGAVVGVIAVLASALKWFQGR
jgi:uncharacterized membrane protein